MLAGYTISCRRADFESSHLPVHRAEHFLSRLDRLPRGEVDLALELYRDPELLRAILHAASLPDEAERVAISIDDPVLGPFLIVTRDGHFVTCLGRGMRAGNLPVIARASLDSASRKLGKLREKIALAEGLDARGERAVKHLLRRLVVAPDTVSREDFLEVAAWEPLLGPSFLDLYLAMSGELLQQATLLRRVAIRGAHGEEALHTYWNLLHAAGHLVLLGTMGGDREHFTTITRDVTAARAAFTYALTGTGVIAFILKGAWAAGRLGKALVSSYKRALVEDVAFFELLDTLFALLAIGLRQSGTRAEIVKALSAAPGQAHTPEARRLREKMGKEVELICELTAQMIESPVEESEESLLRFGATFFTPDAGAADPATHAELLRTLPRMVQTDGITNGKKLAASFTLIAATARGAPEQFYLPRELERALRVPWEPALTWNILEPTRKAEKAGRQTDDRGRNAPCPCGSGKKHKRCCGA